MIFRFLAGAIYMLSQASRLPLEPTHCPVQSLPGTLPTEVKRPWQQIDNFHLPSVEVKNEWSSTSEPLICLNRLDRVNFNFLSSSVFDCHHSKQGVVLKLYVPWTSQLLVSALNMKCLCAYVLICIRGQRFVEFVVVWWRGLSIWSGQDKISFLVVRIALIMYDFFRSLSGLLTLQSTLSSDCFAHVTYANAMSAVT